MKRVFRFPADEKGLRAIVEKLIGQPVSFWEDNYLIKGRIVAAEIKRDRYGNPYVEADVEEESQAGVAA